MGIERLVIAGLMGGALIPLPASVLAAEPETVPESMPTSMPATVPELAPATAPESMPASMPATSPGETARLSTMEPPPSAAPDEEAKPPGWKLRKAGATTALVGLGVTTLSGAAFAMAQVIWETTNCSWWGGPRYCWGAFVSLLIGGFTLVGVGTATGVVGGSMALVGQVHIKKNEGHARTLQRVGTGLFIAGIIGIGAGGYGLFVFFRSSSRDTLHGAAALSVAAVGSVMVEIGVPMMVIRRKKARRSRGEADAAHGPRLTMTPFLSPTADGVVTGISGRF